MKNLWISKWGSSVGIMEISCCYDRWKRSCGVLNIRLGLRHNFCVIGTIGNSAIAHWKEQVIMSCATFLEQWD